MYVTNIGSNTVSVIGIPPTQTAIVSATSCGDTIHPGHMTFCSERARFKDTITADEADALAGRAKTVAAQHYVLHDLQLFADKYVKAWDNVGLNVSNINYS
jgi:hypothetical protein